MKKTQLSLVEKIECACNLLQQAAEAAINSGQPLDADQFLNTAIHLLRDQLGCYFVGLFFLTNDDEWFFIKAGTGEEGHLMLERTRSRGKVGGHSVVGWVLQNRKARVALDVGPEAVHFRDPYVPDAHSEIALPLMSHGLLIGALSILSVEQAAFSEEDIPLFQALADRFADIIQEVRAFG